ncbi:FAS1-like dehydratase domain-containing protein [Umezawaea tangerina]|uniref:MaoC dehydratase-like protein n=1 Tax=Umezawaea tangerina TaxID=84725 RepID=A0A2T0SZR6_9PSEU|nr:MaoC family dehydratase N-terminal domain-containing protein [Umezawaea tangerina]PRY38911.1 MaoC dehydratase-like protein [Umezawaea tangerina]
MTRVVQHDRTAEEAVPTDVDRVVRAGEELVGFLAPDVEPGVDVASWLNVTRFAEALGDENPLYTDPEHGAGSSHHSMLAPPAFVLAVRMPGSAGAADQVDHQLATDLAAVTVTWDDVVRLGDRHLTGRIHVTGVTAELTAAGRPKATVTSTVDYQRDGERIARAQAQVDLVPIADLPPIRPLRRYDPAEIDRMKHELDTEPPPRGTTPRFWKDVTVGDIGVTILKGPLTLADLMVWTFAEGRPVRAGNLVHQRLAERAGRRATHPITQWPVWDRAEAGLDSAVTDPGGPQAPGGLLFALATQYATHWMGDDGFLRQVGARLHRPFRYGDALRLTGSVTDRCTATDEAGSRHHAVHLRVDGRDQLDEPVITAHAVVLLPDPGKPVRLPIRGGLVRDTPPET